MGEVTPIRRRAKGSGVAFEASPSPEDVLRALFRKEAELEAELKDVRRRVGIVRPIYAKKHSLLMLPGVEQLRHLFSL